MTRVLPQLLPECSEPAQQFCASCRAKESGRGIRLTLMRFRGIEGVSADFDCPMGKPWGRGEPPAVSGIGDRYAAALHDRMGSVPCGACRAEQARLNTLTVKEVMRERNAIIEATVSRAMNLTRWRDRIKAKLGNTIAPKHLRRIIGECLDLSLEQEQA